MKKENYYKLSYICSVLLIFGFVIRLGADYIKYDDAINSAPFYSFVLLRILVFILPSILLFILGKYFKNKYNQN